MTDFATVTMWQVLRSKAQAEYPEDIQAEARNILANPVADSIMPPAQATPEQVAVAVAEHIIAQRRYPEEWAALQKAEKAESDYENNEAWR